VVAHFGLQFEPSKAILSAALLTDFFWDQSRRSGQSLSIDVLCSLMLGYFSWWIVLKFYVQHLSWTLSAGSLSIAFLTFVKFGAEGDHRQRSAISVFFFDILRFFWQGFSWFWEPRKFRSHEDDLREINSFPSIFFDHILGNSCNRWSFCLGISRFVIKNS
jgi:hypothetical protein